MMGRPKQYKFSIGNTAGPLGTDHSPIFTNFRAPLAYPRMADHCPSCSLLLQPHQQNGVLIHTNRTNITTYWYTTETIHKYTA